MRDRQDDHLDALIDETARTMTAATPPVTLRSAVRRRIEGPASPLWNWRAGLAAAAVVLLVAFIAGRGWLSVTGERPPAVVGDVVATAASAAAAAVAPATQAPEVPTRPTARRVPRDAPLIVPAPIEIEPLVLEAVDPMVLAVDAIAPPMPLDIMPIVVEPISQE